MTLLIAPISNAFSLGAISITSDCGMTMSASEHQSMMSPEADELNTSNTMTDMSCCDEPASMSCCDDECQCVAFSSAMIWLDTASILSNHRINRAVSSIVQIRLELPFLIKPKRPPISLSS